MLRLKCILQYSNIIFYLFLIILVITFIRCNISIPSKYSIDDKKIIGTLISKQIENDKITLIVKGKEKVRCVYYTEDTNIYNDLELGVTIKLTGTLNHPSNNTIPNTFNYKKYLYYNEINYILTVKNIEVINNEINIFYTLKNMLINYINSFKSRSYLSTFILGDKSLLDEGVYERYQELGVSHIFAISGMHVSILSLILMKLLSRLKDNKKYFIVITFLIFYMFITNYSSSICRTTIFFIFSYLNKRFDFCLDNKKVFYISIGSILLVKPFFMYNTGFLYSSIISYTLISYSHIIKGNRVVKLLKISILALLVSLPITINSNYQINILSIINNLLFVPLISIIIYPLSLLTLVLPFLDNIFFFIMNIVEYISSKALVMNIILPKMNVVVIIIYYLLLYIFLNTYNKRILIIIALLLIVNKYKYLIDNNTYVIYFDVGQGDSSAIINKCDITLIDTGGKMNSNYLYTNNIMLFFKSIGCSKIKTIVTTHGDYDHMGEAINLVNNFKVDKVIFNCGPYNDLEKELIKVLDKKKIKYYSCIKELNIDNNKLYFLQTKEYDNENDNSNVIYAKLDSYKFMFMGDASVITEKEILDKYNLPDIDVLKVGHHGSKTSSSKEFINEINPKYSIISVGKNNRYGHPNKEVLENLKDSKIYRTDQDGSIMFKIKNNKLIIDTCSP